MVTVLSTTRPKARKQHQCDSCCKPILPGTVYERQFSTDGGEAWSHVAHIPCIEAGNILHKAGIEGDEGALISVCDMDRDDRALIYSKSPETYHAVWPDAPIPGTPEVASS
tara:strand:- start:658 stop:990 length:333 start_codon:yes stop_codon:yes gene_type:complete